MDDSLIRVELSGETLTVSEPTHMSWDEVHHRLIIIYTLTTGLRVCGNLLELTRLYNIHHILFRQICVDPPRIRAQTLPAAAELCGKPAARRCCLLSIEVTDRQTDGRTDGLQRL